MFRCLICVLALALLAAGAKAAAAAMAFPGKDWQEAAPADQGIDEARLRAAVAQLSRRCGRDGAKELLIVRSGCVVWKGPRIDRVHGVWSVTKSFTSTVLGLLIEDGKCKLSTRAADVLPSLRAHYRGVTLRHFATMTSGYRAVGDEPRGGYLHGPSPTPFAPGPKPLFAPPGSRFAYWDSAMNQFARVLTRIAGEPIEALFKRRVADPIGMDPAQWDWRDFGRIDGLVVNGGSGNADRHVHISARQLARLGQLFLNRGRWKGKQLLRASWVDAATKVHVPASLPWAQPASRIDGRGVYGLNWWVNGLGANKKRKWPGAPAGTFAASGFNNNQCFVIPAWRMVVVRLGTDGNVPDAVWSAFLSRLGKAIRADARRVGSNGDQEKRK
jgi:CubicO group peptidase (beta-lactamase class C family)